MRMGGRSSSETQEILGPILVCVLAVTIAVYAFLIKGLDQEGVALGPVFALACGLAVFEIWRVVHGIRRQRDRARLAAGDAERHYIDVLRRIVRFVEAREPYAKGHSERIGKLAKSLGRKLGVTGEQVELLGIAGELHDIGLLAIPDGILSKHAKLGVEEFRTVQRHSEVSYEILKPLDLLQDLLPAIRYHHEKMNGTGYPTGIGEEGLSLEARILGVANAYDAMTHDRPYRSAMTPMAAMKELRRCSPHGFDPVVVEALADIAHLPKREMAGVKTRVREAEKA